MSGEAPPRKPSDYEIRAGADLRKGDLAERALEGANLSGAILRGANLRGADLSNPRLDGADLSGAILWGDDDSGPFSRRPRPCDPARSRRPRPREAVTGAGTHAA